MRVRCLGECSSWFGCVGIAAVFLGRQMEVVGAEVPPASKESKQLAYNKPNPFSALRGACAVF